MPRTRPGRVLTRLVLVLTLVVASSGCAVPTRPAAWCTSSRRGTGCSAGG